MHSVSGNIVNPVIAQKNINVAFTSKAIGSIEEFYRSQAIRALDKPILSNSRPQGSEQATVMSRFVFCDTWIRHESRPELNSFLRCHKVYTACCHSNAIVSQHLRKSTGKLDLCRSYCVRWSAAP